MSQPAQTQVSPYEVIGGDDGIRRLVDRFYDLMQTDPAFAELRAMHAADLAPMREKLAAFFSGWLGGPRRYNACVMSAHAPFAIGAREAGQWLACMGRAMDETQMSAPLSALLAPAFARMAQGMRKS